MPAIHSKVLGYVMWCEFYTWYSSRQRKLLFDTNKLWFFSNKMYYKTSKLFKKILNWGLRNVFIFKQKYKIIAILFNMTKRLIMTKRYLIGKIGASQFVASFILLWKCTSLAMETLGLVSLPFTGLCFSGWPLQCRMF